MWRTETRDQLLMLNCQDRETADLVQVGPRDFGVMTEGGQNGAEEWREGRVGEGRCAKGQRDCKVFVEVDEVVNEGIIATIFFLTNNAVAGHQ